MAYASVDAGGGGLSLVKGILVMQERAWLRGNAAMPYGNGTARGGTLDVEGVSQDEDEADESGTEDEAKAEATWAPIQEVVDRPSSLLR